MSCKAISTVSPREEENICLHEEDSQRPTETSD